MSIDFNKTRRETLRWYFIVALNNARPRGAGEALLLAIAQEISRDATAHEVHRELDYLEEHGLVEIRGKKTRTWEASLTGTGIDYAEYVGELEFAGIARPEQYW